VSAPIRVLIIDDDALVRAGLTMLLAGAGDIEIVGEAADGSEVEDAVAERQPDVVLMDIRMPGMDGLAATEILRGRDRRPRSSSSPPSTPTSTSCAPCGPAPAASSSRTRRPPESSAPSEPSRPASRSCPPRSPAG
jgi:CheY-like chemotaxis protein